MFQYLNAIRLDSNSPKIYEYLVGTLNVPCLRSQIPIANREGYISKMHPFVQGNEISFGIYPYNILAVNNCKVDA